MKVKVRTKQGGFRDDRVELTTKWQDFDESEISATWVDNPNIEIMRDGKQVPTPDPGEATTVITRPTPNTQLDDELREKMAPIFKAITKDET